MQSSYLNRLLDFGRIARMIENEALNGDQAYSYIEMMSDLRKGIWNEIYQFSKIETFRRNLQLAYIERIEHYLRTSRIMFHQAIGTTPLQLKLVNLT